MSVRELISFIFSDKPIYVKDDLKIEFVNGFVVNHPNWDSHSLCNSCVSKALGYGEISENYKNKLVVDFKSFDCSRQTYLTIEFISKDLIKIRHDEYNRSGIILEIFSNSEK